MLSIYNEVHFFRSFSITRFMKLVVIQIHCEIELPRDKSVERGKQKGPLIPQLEISSEDESIAQDIASRMSVCTHKHYNSR